VRAPPPRDAPPPPGGRAPPPPPGAGGGGGGGGGAGGDLAPPWTDTPAGGMVHAKPAACLGEWAPCQARGTGQAVGLRLPRRPGQHARAGAGAQPARVCIPDRLPPPPHPARRAGCRSCWRMATGGRLRSPPTCARRRCTGDGLEAAPDRSLPDRRWSVGLAWPHLAAPGLYKHVVTGLLLFVCCGGKEGGKTALQAPRAQPHECSLMAQRGLQRGPTHAPWELPPRFPLIVGPRDPASKVSPINYRDIAWGGALLAAKRVSTARRAKPRPGRAAETCSSAPPLSAHK
jgi:hypothetical protein